MRARLIKLMFDLRASYWFVPSIMALMAILLGAVMISLDASATAPLLDRLGWYQKAKPDGAREMLSTIAGSMITVAGVVFSITIVAIAYASSQYGPRILTNFMSDRGNQLTLGTFIATFVYCLVVLRTVRGGEAEFVPQFAVLIGLLLALASIAVLIFFIHHIPRSIHINTVAAEIGKQLLHFIDERFPALGEDPPKGDRAPGREQIGEQALARGRGVARIPSTDTGYIEAVDDATLMHKASGRDLILQLHHQPGDFVFGGQLLVSAWPQESVDEETRDALRSSYSIGNKRTPAQDFFFLVDELVEIAARALSTGVNDPYTAVTCLDWLTAAAAKLGGRPIPSPRQVDREGVVRLIAEPDSFAGFIERGFGRMRPYVARDMTAAAHAFDSLAAIGVQCDRAEVQLALRKEAARLLAMAEQELRGPSLEKVREHHEKAAARLV